MMTCIACAHEKRREINRALVLGEPERAIASRYGVNRSSLNRHRACLAEAIDRARLADGISARQVVMELVGDLRTMARTTFDEKREAAFLATATVLARAAESLGKLNGEVVAASVQGFLMALGVSDEREVRDALEMRRSMGSANVGEFEQELLAGMRFLLAEHPDFRATALALLESGSRAEVIEPNGNGDHA